MWWSYGCSRAPISCWKGRPEEGTGGRERVELGGTFSCGRWDGMLLDPGEREEDELGAVRADKF